MTTPALHNLTPLLLAAANRMAGEKKIFDKTSPAAYAYLLRKAAIGADDLDDAPAWLTVQLAALLDPEA